MKLNVGVFLVFAVSRIYSDQALLDIAPRLQWDNNNGYCGETSIIQSGLYYGSYFSQNVVRNVAGGEVLFEDNLETAVNALSMTSVAWSRTSYLVSTSGEMDKYCIWFKQQLGLKYPIIYSAVHKSSNYKPFNNAYDHIVTAIGFEAASAMSYLGEDKLIWDDHYAKMHLTTTFADLRAKSILDWTLFGPVQYAVAVSGIKDESKKCLPVRLYLERWDEPNVTLKEKPVSLTVRIKISSLLKNHEYSIFRYDDYKKVPSTAFSAQPGSFSKTFIATADTILLSDNIQSDGVAIYRCVQTSGAVPLVKATSTIRMSNAGQFQINGRNLTVNKKRRTIYLSTSFGK